MELGWGFVLVGKKITLYLAVQMVLARRACHVPWDSILCPILSVSSSHRLWICSFVQYWGLFHRMQLHLKDHGCGVHLWADVRSVKSTDLRRCGLRPIFPAPLAFLCPLLPPLEKSPTASPSSGELSVRLLPFTFQVNPLCYPILHTAQAMPPSVPGLRDALMKMVMIWSPCGWG